ncbi:MAG: MBL fold metallo-hydrolase [Desulfomonilaceae bacterium]
MIIRILTVVIMSMVLICSVYAQSTFETDKIRTSQGDLSITLIGHGTLMFTHNGKVVHVDPWTKLANYSKLPKADLILITHEHQDHLDLDAVSKIKKENVKIFANQKAAEKLPGSTVMKNGDVNVVDGITIEAVPAYNLVHKRSSGEPFHPKGLGNGYVITFGDKRVYVAGDTENTPEMKALKNIDIAFLPMNLPYTMTPEMVADAAKSFKPKVLYPYHTGETDLSKLLNLMKDSGDTKVDFRNMK